MLLQHQGNFFSGRGQRRVARGGYSLVRLGASGSGTHPPECKLCIHTVQCWRWDRREQPELCVHAGTFDEHVHVDR